MKIFLKFILTATSLILWSEPNAQNTVTLKIGNQEWMAENLNVEKFRNGDPIPQAMTKEDWKKAGNEAQPAWCYYDDNPDNGTKMARLYNWYAVTDSRGLAPVGWHVPTNVEWTTLIDYLGGDNSAGAKMKSKEGWFKGGNGSNSLGFSGLPSGMRNYAGVFLGIGEIGSWWTVTEQNSSDAFYLSIAFDGDGIVILYGSRKNGFAVRCIKD